MLKSIAVESPSVSRSRSVEAGKNNPGQGEIRKSGSVVRTQYHSALAMQAARRMKTTREKRKTGQMVCHHLRMMLESVDPNARRHLPRVENNQYRLSF